MSARALGLTLLGAVLALWLVSLATGYDVVADVHPELAKRGPDAGHWLGTDHLGRDVFWRLVTGSEAFVPTGVAASSVAGVLGVAAGALSGWFGGAPESGIRYALTVIASLPRFVLVLLACAILGAEPWVLAVASGVAYAPALGEAIHARIEGLRRAEFVLAARAHGLPESRILLFHLLWVNCRGLVARHLLQAFGFFVLIETTLSYLGGFGVQEPTPSWGNMLAFEFGITDGNVYAWLAPAVALSLAILGAALVGQDQREAADVSLRAEGLRVAAGSRVVVDDATIGVDGGELVALVGSSGSGKTLTARALLGMLPCSPGRIGGDVTFEIDGVVHRPRTEAEFRPLRGGVVGMLWQDARGALDPLWTVARQVREAIALSGATEPVETWLERAGFSDAARVARLYPHELSGGMAQRAAIAIALARRSRFLVADEPTTGLDPSVQRAILTQLRELCASGVGVLFITHDLRILPDVADRVVVMDAGRILEEAASPANLVGAGRGLVEATRKVAGGAL